MSGAEEPRQGEAAHPGSEQDIEAVYRMEVAELLAKVQPTFALWRQRGDNPLLAAAAQALPAMVLGLAAGVGAEWRALGRAMRGRWRGLLNGPCSRRELRSSKRRGRCRGTRPSLGTRNSARTAPSAAGR
jgi:hypothetical protein